jgi:hypothetical protein
MPPARRLLLEFGPGSQRIPWTRGTYIATMQYMPAVLIAQAKEVRDDGSIIEIVVWELSAPLAPSTHNYKYRQ